MGSLRDLSARLEPALPWLILGAIAAIVVVMGFSIVGYSERHQKQEIESFLSRVTTENDPAQCTEDFTDALLNQNFGGRDGETPMEACRRRNTEDEGALADSVDVQNIFLGDGFAEAVIRITGGDMEGSEFKVQLLGSGDDWRLHLITHAEIDRAGYNRGLVSSAIESGATPAEAQCMADAFNRNVTDEQLEDMIIQPGNRPDSASIGTSCLSRASLAEGFNKGLANAMQEDDVPQPIIDCVTARFTPGLSGADLRAMTQNPDALSAEDGQRLRSVTTSCAQDYTNGVLPRSGQS
jgi:hypothetical protein